MSFHELENKIQKMVDELQGLCSTVGLSNSADEEVVVTSVFLYKFLNDKFMHSLEQFEKETGKTSEQILTSSDELRCFYRWNSDGVAFAWEDTIQYLASYADAEGFAEKFDKALKHIADSEYNQAFAVETSDGEKTPLFVPLTPLVEAKQRDNFAHSIFSIITKDKFDFSDAFDGGFDFYSTIFEYLIKNYNVASGTYAEYFTPQTISSIIAKILVGMSEKVDAAEIYDASAGSGSLILHLAHELGQEDGVNRAVIYTQDISAKSSRFLRLNMLLNGKSESLGNVIRGDTLENPAHFTIPHDPSSGLKKFDYITINPPFKLDFSKSRDRIATNWENTERFFAGVPKIPPKEVDKMPAYLLFVQHAMYSLSERGKAALVVPTGFLTEKTGIAKKIRVKMVEENMLVGVISMPSNIFANTGTNVSVIFLDKANRRNDVVLMDASKLGEKFGGGKNQRTVLRRHEVDKIINSFINREEIDGFSTVVSFDTLKDKKYSFAAGQYFNVKIEYIDISAADFQKHMDASLSLLSHQFLEGKNLEDNIMKQMKGLIYEN